MNIKSTNLLDKHIGTRLRMQRMLMGLSQERLGEMLGITFQQVQKYEKGANRISASRLHDIARVLAVDIEFFFQGSPAGKSVGNGNEPAEIIDFLGTRDGFQLARAFLAIPDQGMRRAIVDLVHAAGRREALPSNEGLTSPQPSRPHPGPQAPVRNS